MAAKEDPGASVVASPPQQGDTIKQDVQAAAAAVPAPPIVVTVPSVPTVYSDASPTQPLSPQHQFPALPTQGNYPTPLASQEAVISDEALFMDTFNKFHITLLSHPTVPKMGGKDLDLHLLYKEVSSRGGLQAVIRDRKWKDITLAFQFPSTTTSASYVLRKYYVALLYHYEQVYRNGVTGPLSSPPAGLSASPSAQGLDSAVSEGGDSVVRKRVRKRREPKLQLPAVDPAEAIGSTVSGAIEGKVDFGYLVSMVIGGETLQGVLYHVPPTSKVPQHATIPGLLNAGSSELAGIGVEVQTRRKRRRKDEMPKKDPNAPRANRTGYNFFFAEQRQRLKALHPEKDREISRMIGEAWNALSEQEKQPYQERGVRDKERFTRETCDYKEKKKSGYYDNPANTVNAPAGVIVANGQGLADNTASPEDPNNGDHTNAMQVDTHQVSEALVFVPTQEPTDPMVTSDELASDQLQSAPNPASLVPTQ